MTSSSLSTRPVEMASGRIKGAEALARWRHPQKGIINPSEFIVPMEANGLIDELSWSMLKKSAMFCRDWQAVSKPQLGVAISVNLSVKSLADARLEIELQDDQILIKPVKRKLRNAWFSEIAQPLDIDTAKENDEVQAWHALPSDDTEWQW